MRDDETPPDGRRKNVFYCKRQSHFQPFKYFTDLQSQSPPTTQPHASSSTQVNQYAMSKELI